MQKALIFALTALLLAGGCGDDDPEPQLSAAQVHGVGAACTRDADCTEIGQSCLNFKGGYCGITDCTEATGCPQGSACVRHDDGASYCFRLCADKPECNLYRSVDNQANCSANVDYVDTTVTAKACVPPSG